jgi:hypothetical protein
MNSNQIKAPVGSSIPFLGSLQVASHLCEHDRQTGRRMEIFLVLVVAVVYAPLLLLLWVARKDSRPSLDMDHSARNAFWHGASNTSIKIASLNIRYSPANQQPKLPWNTWQEYPWVYRKCVFLFLFMLLLSHC